MYSVYTLFKNGGWCIAIVILLSSCSGFKESPKYQLSDGRYQFKQKPDVYKDAFVYVNEDTLSISLIEGDKQTPFTPDLKSDLYFIKRSFDVDVVTVLFKLRPTTAELPRQLTTDFNGNVYFGYRIDRFRWISKETPIGPKRLYRHRGLSLGAFGGLGSTAVSPWTTNNQTADEYTGLVLSRGFAVLAGINNLTVGVSVGWDYLTDRDKDIWIYQNKPWYGLTLGLNLN